MIPSLTVEQYVELDDRAETKSEFHDGQLFPLAENTIDHDLIVTRLGAALLSRLAGRSCIVAANTRVALPGKRQEYCRPDVAVSCDPAISNDRVRALLNPALIVEVLSPSISGYDYSAKFDLYRTIESFREYLLVFQNEPRADLFSRQPDGSWVLRVHIGLDAVIPIPSLNLSIKLDEVYTEVPFQRDSTEARA